MTPEEVSGVVALLATAFGRTMTVETIEAYAYALEDLEIEDPVGQVKRLLRTLDRWPPPAVIRKALLDAYGVLPPDVDQVWPQVVRWASYSTDPYAPDRPVISDLARQAVEAVGGSWAIKHSDRSIIYAQWRDAYRAIVARETHESLARSWNGLPLAPASQLPLRDGTDRGLGPG